MSTYTNLHPNSETNNFQPLNLSRKFYGMKHVHVFFFKANAFEQNTLISRFMSNRITNPGTSFTGWTCFPAGTAGQSYCNQRKRTLAHGSRMTQQYHDILPDLTCHNSGKHLGQFGSQCTFFIDLYGKIKAPKASQGWHWSVFLMVYFVPVKWLC